MLKKKKRQNTKGNAIVCTCGEGRLAFDKYKQNARQRGYVPRTLAGNERKSVFTVHYHISLLC